LPLLPQPFGLFLQRLYMVLLPARFLEAKTITLIAHKISGLICRSRANFTCGRTCAMTPHLLGVPERLTPCFGSMMAMGCFLLPTTTPLRSTLADTHLLQQFASLCPLATIESELASAAVTQRLTDLVAITTI
jgi:hypothetical protein